MKFFPKKRKVKEVKHQKDEIALLLDILNRQEVECLKSIQNNIFETNEKYLGIAECLV